MTLIALGSVAGSPGASTLALGLAAVWPGDHAVLVEADPDGGRLGAELGVATEPGLVAAALAARSAGCTGPDLVDQVAAPLDDGWSLIPGPPSPEQSSAVLSRSAPSLARVFAGAGHVAWLVDCGRLSTRSPAMPIATAAQSVVLVSHGSFASLQLMPARVSALVSARCAVGLAISGPTLWPADEIASFVGCDVVAILPNVRVRRTARSMAGGEWAAWWAVVRRLVEHLQAVPAPTPLSPSMATAEAGTT